MIKFNHKKKLPGFLAICRDFIHEYSGSLIDYISQNGGGRLVFPAFYWAREISSIMTGKNTAFDHNYKTTLASL